MVSCRFPRTAAPPGETAPDDSYFIANPPPADLDKAVKQATEFIDYHIATGRRVVLVTSGGTIVPLEKRMVRFIDNFSAGTRGAASAEYFISAGYAVIFLHRQFSLQPYSRHYSHESDSFLDFLDLDSESGKVTVRSEDHGLMLQILRRYREVKSKNLLLMLSFVTINDYLHMLRGVSRAMQKLGRNGLLYLAAAVSDFFLPPDRISEHKIQSTDFAATGPDPRCEKIRSGEYAGEALCDPLEASKGEEEVFDNFDSCPAVPRQKQLLINLDPVPKFLKNLVDDWSPECMIVSYKLETDPRILVDKAMYALRRYQHDLVIGNLLTTRKHEVVFVSPRREEPVWIRLPGYRRASMDGVDGKAAEPESTTSCEPAASEMEIESLIIPAVVKLHDEHISKESVHGD